MSEQMMFKAAIGAFFISAFCALGLRAQEPIQPVTDENNTPVGMEAGQVTPGYRLLVPKGAKIWRAGAQILVEGDKEYLSRRFFELSQEISDLKDQVKALQTQVDQLSGQVQPAAGDAAAQPQKN